MTRTIQQFRGPSSNSRPSYNRGPSSNSRPSSELSILQADASDLFKSISVTTSTVAKPEPE
eukprot:8084996-Pyramimonas_sp.AAC.1